MEKESQHLFTAGHTACSGCGQAIAARLVVDIAGKNTMIANNTGCLEVFPANIRNPPGESPGYTLCLKMRRQWPPGLRRP